jgi:hypothetical protein
VGKILLVRVSIVFACIVGGVVTRFVIPPLSEAEHGLYRLSIGPVMLNEMVPQSGPLGTRYAAWGTRGKEH